MSDVVIRAAGLGKKYLIDHRSVERQRYTALRDEIGRAAKGLIRSVGAMIRGHQLGVGNEVEIFWALKDINFEIKRGEVVGIIGRNGAGKSTLLKVLSRITEPTEGRVEIKGRVASLLEVGTGFHPELSGRENIYLNGAILGMTRSEIRRKFDAIVAFSGIEKFLDTPVKRFSSGMSVRLAFAVAAHLEPEILIVDEVLAVGDAEFQKKCLGKMGEVAGHGRTVLFVSHNMGAIRALCNRAVLLSKGAVEQIGSTDTTIEKYMSALEISSPSGGKITWADINAPGSNVLRAIEFSARGKKTRRFGLARTDEDIEIELLYEQGETLPGARVVFQLLTSGGELVFASTDHNARSVGTYHAGRYKTLCRIPSHLLNRGTYLLQFRAGIPGCQILIPDTDACMLRVDGPSNHGSAYDMSWPGTVCPLLTWHIEAQG